MKSSWRSPGTRPQFLEELGVVVLDEIQMIEDDSRGRTLELLLVRLQRLRRQQAWPQLIVLCAELANFESLQTWLGLTVIGTTSRPVPLSEGVLEPSGRVTLRRPLGGLPSVSVYPGFPAVPKAGRPARYENDSRAHAAIALARHLVITQRKQVLFFCLSGWQAMRLAEWLGEDLSLPPAADLVVALARADETQQHRARARLTAVAGKGVAFHIGDLDRQERMAVEDGFRAGTLRAVVATPTLAMGVNSPTDVVVLVDNAIYNYELARDVPIKVSMYRNMAGRAGRLLAGGPPEGLALMIAHSDPDAQRMLALYINGPLPALASRLGNLPPQDLVLALLQLQPEASAVQLTEDLAGTYWGFLQERSDLWVRTQRRRLEESLAQLTIDGFTISDTPGRWKLTARGRAVAGFGMEVRSAHRLLHAIARIRVAAEPIDVLALALLTQLTVEMDRVVMPKGTTPPDKAESERGPLRSRPVLWDALVDPAGIGGDVGKAVGDRVHRLQAIVPWLRGIKLSEIERVYARERPDEPVAGRFRGMVDRTIDLLPAVAAMLLVELPDRSAEIKAAYGLARHQLAIGGSAAVAQLHSLRLNLTRHQCQQFVEMGITTEDSLREALVRRRQELEAALSTAEVHALDARVNDTRARRRREPKVEQMVLDGFGDDSAV